MDPYLPSGQPAPENLLAPLSSKSFTGAAKPSLSSLRLRQTRSFIEHPESELSNLKVNLPDPFEALPALSSRIRHHKSRHVVDRPELIAALDIEVAPFSKQDVELTSVKISFTGGNAIDLGQGKIPKLPLECRPKDNIVFLYRLNLDEPVPGHENASAAGILDVSIHAVVLTSPECRPRIQMHWSTTVDVSTVMNSAHASQRQSMQRINRPPDLSIPSNSAGAKDGSTYPAEVVVAQTKENAALAEHVGISITFTAPPKAYVHEEFKLDVLLLNKLNRAQRLTIATRPMTQTSTQKSDQAKSLVEPSSKQKGKHVADAVIDDNELLATTYQGAKTQAPEVLALTASAEFG